MRGGFLKRKTTFLKVVIVENDSIERAAMEQNLQFPDVDIEFFAAPEDLIRELDVGSYAAETCFFIDYNYGKASNLTGADLAEELSNRGFSNIYLHSGQPRGSIKELLGSRFKLFQGILEKGDEFSLRDKIEALLKEKNCDEEVA